MQMNWKPRNLTEHGKCLHSGLRAGALKSGGMGTRTWHTLGRAGRCEGAPGGGGGGSLKGADRGRAGAEVEGPKSACSAVSRLASHCCDRSHAGDCATPWAPVGDSAAAWGSRATGAPALRSGPAAWPVLCRCSCIVLPEASEACRPAGSSGIPVFEAATVPFASGMSDALVVYGMVADVERSVVWRAAPCAASLSFDVKQSDQFQLLSSNEPPLPVQDHVRTE